MPELEKLLEQIEVLRENLNDLGSKRVLSDPEIIHASRMLDAVLNEYQKLLEETTRGRS